MLQITDTTDLTLSGSWSSVKYLFCHFKSIASKRSKVIGLNQYPQHPKTPIMGNYHWKLPLALYVTPQLPVAEKKSFLKAFIMFCVLELIHLMVMWLL